MYAQDEIFFSNTFRWVVGVRVDRFDYIDDFVFAPRTTFMIKPREDQAIRLSYNRAYRSPSVVNNFLDVTLAELSIESCFPADRATEELLRKATKEDPDPDVCT